MKIDNILEAEKEAERFLKRLKDLKKVSFGNTIFNKNNTHSSGCKETGALKRSSLDLSRILSKMRNDIW